MHKSTSHPVVDNRIATFLQDVLPAQVGYQANSVQAAYAGSVIEALAQPGQLHFVEGDTGIGKSLAYTLALADWVARGKAHNRRAIVSTHTRALQRQLMAPAHLGLVDAYLQHERLPSVSTGLRMGRSNYVSPMRLALALGAPDLEGVLADTERPADERALAEWALDTPGCLLDLSPEVLPEGVALGDICLLPQEPLPRALEEHFQAAQGHDILIINHALLTVDLVTGGRITHAETPYALLVDEADRFPDAAESLLSERLSLRSAASLLSQLGARSAASLWQEIFESWMAPAFANDAFPLSPGQRQQLGNALKAIRRARPNLNAAGAALSAEWHRMKKQAETLARRLDSPQGDAVLVSYSPMRGLPSVVAQEPSAGRCMKVGADHRVTILTSATLSDMQHGPGEAPRFDYLRGRLQMGAADNRLGLTAIHPARRFGQMRFTLPDDMPAPLWQPEPGRYALSPTFASMAVRRIRSLQGRVLVLVNAYSDADALRETWPAEDDRLVTHAPGASISTIAEALEDDAVFVTPAGWEGLSPPRGDRAFWDHVVILRLPNPVPDPVLQVMLEHRFIQFKGLAPGEAAAAARRTLIRQGSIRAAHKLRQGLGRGIRHPDDDVHIVILDPRFPSPSGDAAGEGTRRHAHAVGAIPPRFLASYRRSETTWPDDPATRSRETPSETPSWQSFL